MTHTDQRVQSPGQAIGRVELSVDVGQQQLPVLGAEGREARDGLRPPPDDLHGRRQQLIELSDVTSILLLGLSEYLVLVLMEQTQEDRSVNVKVHANTHPHTYNEMYLTYVE